MTTCTLGTHIAVIPKNHYSVTAKGDFFMHTFITGGVSVMCNEHFAEVPNHEEYQIIVNYGEEEIACSGEGLVTSITFLELPTLLIFNVDEHLAALSKFLDDIPKLINVDNQNYNLGGVTVFVNQRRHYVVYVYIKESDSFIFYDGLYPEEFGRRKSKKFTRMENYLSQFILRKVFLVSQISIHVFYHFAVPNKLIKLNQNIVKIKYTSFIATSFL